MAFEQELRHQLKRQAAAHSDHLAEVLKVQENELHAKYDTLLGERLSEARDEFRESVAGSIARLKGIEAAIDGRYFDYDKTLGFDKSIVVFWTYQCSQKISCKMFGIILKHI